MRLPGLRYLDLAGLGIRLRPFDLYERILKFAPALTHLRLPMRMAGGLESALGLGFGVRVAPDHEGVEDDKVAIADEQVTATAVAIFDSYQISCRVFAVYKLTSQCKC